MGHNSRLNQSCCYDQEIKLLPSQWKAHHSTCEESEAGHRLNMEEHICSFFTCETFVRNFVPSGQSVNPSLLAGGFSATEGVHCTCPK